MLQLISATPSPYARKVRIALAEKGIPLNSTRKSPGTAQPQPRATTRWKSCRC